MSALAKSVPAAVVIVALLGAAALAPLQPDYPGRPHRVRPQDLLPPFETPPATNPPFVIPRPARTSPLVPAGFRVNVFAERLGRADSPRTMAVAPNGDLFVVESGDNQIVVLRDPGKRGVATQRSTFATRLDGLARPFGIAFHDSFLYVANTNGVIRFPYRPGQLRRAGRAQVVVSGLPGLGYNQHWTRNLVFSPDGGKLYVSVGSESNLGVEEARRAAILEYNPDGSGFRVYASGIRNPVGLAFNPVTQQLSCTCNERDGLGDDLAPDFFTSVQDGGFYGWPYSYIGPNLDPRMHGAGQDLAQSAIVPDVLFQAHSAPLGLSFYTGSRFPQPYLNDAFIAFHGSWNRSLRTGYKVVRVHLENGQPDGSYEDFMTGFMLDPADQAVWGRPVGVTVAADGALLISDDGGHRIWRVTYTGQ